MLDSVVDQLPIDVLVEEYSAQLRTGSAPSVEDFARRHPEQAGELRDLLPAVVVMEQARRRRQSAQSSVHAAVPDWVGDFQIVREIGRGGMGIVYEALERTLNRRVALKILPGHAMLDPVRLQRFQREAQAAAQLHHTNIVPVFGVGEADRLHYYVMQFIEGRSLQQIVGNQGSGVRNQESGIRGQESGIGGHWRWAARVAAQVADALHYAHTHGILHRDIKPGNVMVDPQDTAWITDFGLAKFTHDDSLTRSGDIVGTLQYLAPESMAGVCDARADIYSLGLTLYEVLTCRPPYSETTAAGLIQEIATREPVPPRKIDPRIPQDLETIVLKAAARAPEQRYQSAADLAADLRRFLEDRPILARKTGAVERAARWCRRNRTVAALAAAAAASLLIALAAGWAGYAQTTAALKREAQKSADAHDAEQRAEANVQMSLNALEEMFEQLKTQLTADNRPPPHPENNAANHAAANSDFHPDGRHEPHDRHGSSDPHGPPGAKLDAVNSVGLLQSILSFYERFAEKNATNAKLQLESARAYERVGELQFRLGALDKAEDAFNRATLAVRRLSDNASLAAELQKLTEKIDAHVGDLLQSKDDAPGAAEAYRNAVEILAPIAAADFLYRGELTRWYIALGDALAKQKQYDAAIAAWREPLAFNESDAVTIDMARQNANTLYRRLSEVYALKGDAGAAAEAAKQAERKW